MSCSNYNRRAGEMPQSVRHLLSENEAPSSDPQHPDEKQDMMAHASNLSAGEVETGGALKLTD